MELHTETSGGAAELLGLRSVLASSLPAALMTDTAPDRYTVEAVFTRRPGHDEVQQILSGDTREYLSRAGYPTVELTVSDRRLEIANTNLEELRDGLASTLADRLAQISAGVHAKQEAAATRSRDAAASEHDRAAAVTALAETVRFETSRGSGQHEPTSAGAASDAADRAQVDDWTDEGGHGR